MYPKKKKEEYIASRLAREALEDVNCPKQIAYEDIRPHFTKRDPYRTKEDLEEVILGVAVFSEYLKTRQAYRFHPVLAAELNASTELNFRMQDLHLPCNAFYMDISECGMSVDGKAIIGVYALNSIVEQMFAIVALVKISHDKIIFMKASMDYSDGETIQKSFSRMDGGHANEKSFYHLLFSLISYISSDEPDIVDRGKETIIVRAKNLRPAPSITRHWDVGYRYVKLYQKTLGFVPTKEALHCEKETHNSPRKHLRAAHWHTYLYGPGKKQRKVLWVAATWVGTGDEDIDVIHLAEKKEE